MLVMVGGNEVVDITVELNPLTVNERLAASI
jgi:hypothetical protein